MAAHVDDAWEYRRKLLLAPMVRDRKGEYRKELNSLLRDGFVRARIDGEIVDLKADMRLERYKRHTIEVVVDRLKPSRDGIGRLREAVARDPRSDGLSGADLAHLVREAATNALRDLRAAESGGGGGGGAGGGGACWPRGRRRWR